MKCGEYSKNSPSPGCDKVEGCKWVPKVGCIDDVLYKMIVYIKGEENADGVNIILNINKDSTITNIKQLIEKYTGIKIDDQIIIYDDQVVNDDNHTLKQFIELRDE